MSGLNFISFRLANVYGPKNFSGPIPIFYANLKNNIKSRVYKTKRDFIFVSDVVNCIIKSLKTETFDSYFNISTGLDIEISEIYLLLEKELGKSNDYDLVNTNRFLDPRSLDDWPFSRIIFTKIRFFLNLILLNVSYDSSGAFRCYNLKKINPAHIFMSKSNSYSFFWESMFILKEKKYSIFEIPILLPYRKNGDSKITIFDIINSFILIWVFFLKRIIRFYK